MTAAVATRENVQETEYRIIKSLEITNNHSYYAAAVGLVPMPLVDIAGLTIVQLRMIREICKVYETPFNQSMVKSILASLLASSGATAATYGGLRSLAKSVPVVGGLLGVATMPTVAMATTYAVGVTFASHFESGGWIGDLNVDKAKVRLEKIRKQAGKIIKPGHVPAEIAAEIKGAGDEGAGKEQPAADAETGATEKEGDAGGSDAEKEQKTAPKAAASTRKKP